MQLTSQEYEGRITKFEKDKTAEGIASFQPPPAGFKFKFVKKAAAAVFASLAEAGYENNHWDVHEERECWCPRAEIWRQQWTAATTQEISVAYTRNMRIPTRNATHNIQSCAPPEVLKEGEVAAVVAAVVNAAATPTVVGPKTSGCATGAVRLDTCSETASRRPQDMVAGTRRRRRKPGRGAGGLMLKSLDGADTRTSAWTAEAAAPTSAALAPRKTATVGRMEAFKRR